MKGLQTFSGPRLQGLGRLGVQGSGFRVQGLGSKGLGWDLFLRHCSWTSDRRRGEDFGATSTNTPQPPPCNPCPSLHLKPKNSEP